MFSVLAATLVTSLPALKPLKPPLATFTVEILQSDTAAQNGDALLPFTNAECTTRAVSAIHAMGAALTMLEKLQRWLDENPGAETKLFRKGTLGEVMRHVSQGAFGRLVPCRTITPVDVWKWPARDFGTMCLSKTPLAAAERWLTVKKVQSSALLVQPAATNPCQPRLSIALFDPRGKTRAVLHADFGGVMSAVVVGDRCQIELTYAPDIEGFRPEWKSCKG
jgi:hypothetical protein